MPQIDVELPDNLQRFLEQPRCLDLGLPEPSSVSLTLPTGGTLKGIGDVTKGIPTDCSLSFSLLAQLGPLLGSIDCIVKILKLVEPLQEVITSLPFPPVEAIKKFVEAAGDVAECATAFIPGSIPLLTFIKDVLYLVIRIMNCLIQQYKSIADVMAGLSVQIEQARADGNEELLANLKCAQQNAAISAAATNQAIEPVIVILELVGPLLEIAQIGSIEIPTFGSAEDAEQISEVIAVLEEFVGALQLVADGLGGCD